MNIVKVEACDQMVERNVCYELDGVFYVRCWHCGKPVRVERHLTAADIRREQPGESQYFCNEACEKAWFLAVYPTVDDALFAGEEERAEKFFKMKIYLSDQTVKNLIKHDCDYGSAEDTEEMELMEKVVSQLSRRGSDKKFDLSPEVFEFVIDRLDWYCGAYWDEQKED